MSRHARYSDDEAEVLDLSTLREHLEHDRRLDADGDAAAEAPDEAAPDDDISDPRAWGKWWEPVADALDEYRAAARRRDALRRRTIALRGVPDAEPDRAFMDLAGTVAASRRVIRLARLEREKALFFARVAVAAPWTARRDALVRADRFARHLAALLGSRDHLLRRVEEHEALRRVIRRELYEGGVSLTTVMPSGPLRRFDEARFAVADAHGHAKGALRAAAAEVRAARSPASQALLTEYLWRDPESILHKRRTIRVVCSAMPLAERVEWLHEIHSCLAETAAEKRSRVAAGFVVAAPRAIVTAWFVSRRRARAAKALER